jgi:hypothetical protein
MPDCTAVREEGGGEWPIVSRVLMTVRTAGNDADSSKHDITETEEAGHK